MGWMSKVGEMLQKYDSPVPSIPDEEVEEHFTAVADSAPRSEVSDGIAQAFRSDATPPFEDMVSKLFGSSSPSQKAALLNLLLPRAGSPLDKLVQKVGLNTSRARGSELPGGQPSIPPEQAQKVDPAAVRALAAEARQQDPSIMDRAGELYAQHPSLVRNLGGAALAIALAHIAKKSRTM